MSPRSRASRVYRRHNTAAHTRARAQPAILHHTHTSPPPPALTKTNMKLEKQAGGGGGQKEQYKDCHCGIIHKAPELGARQHESSPGLREEPRV